MADLAATARRRAQGKTLAVISPLALEAVRRIHALFEIERSVNGQSAERRRAVRQEFERPSGVGQPGLRIDIVQFGSENQTVHHCGALAAAVGTGE